MTCKEIALAVAAHIRECKEIQEHQGKSGAKCRLDSVLSAACCWDISSDTEIAEWLEEAAND